MFLNHRFMGGLCRYKLHNGFKTFLISHSKFTNLFIYASKNDSSEINLVKTMRLSKNQALSCYPSPATA